MVEVANDEPLPTTMMQPMKQCDRIAPSAYANQMRLIRGESGGQRGGGERFGFWHWRSDAQFLHNGQPQDFPLFDAQPAS